MGLGHWKYNILYIILDMFALMLRPHAHIVLSYPSCMDLKYKTLTGV